MSRPSRVARESIFNTGSQLHGHELQATCSPSLLECVQNLEDVNAETHDTQLLLRAGTSDLKRISHVLASQRVFVFVNESTVRKYKADLEEEIEPQIRELIERAKKGAKALEKRHLALKNKVEHVPVMKAAVTRTAAGRLEAQRLELLATQRQQLEKELKALQEDINELEGN